MRRFWLSFGICALLVCCAKDATPTDPVWGKQACAHCAMLVSDPRYAAQLLTTASERKYFDDIGCMLSYVAEGKSQAAKLWVRSEESQWVEARQTKYATGAPTPMDYGFVTSRTGSRSFSELEKIVTKTERGGSP
jgi:hypothetical protein